MEIVDGAGVLRKQSLQQIVSGIGSDFLANQAEANAHSPHVCIDGQDGLLTAKEQDCRGRFWYNSLEAIEPCRCFLYGQLA